MSNESFPYASRLVQIPSGIASLNEVGVAITRHQWTAIEPSFNTCTRTLWSQQVQINGVLHCSGPRLAWTVHRYYRNIRRIPSMSEQ